MSDDQLIFLAGGGEMGERTRAFEWSVTPVGPVGDWPQSLKVAVRIMLDSRYPMFLTWGPEFTFFYNDAYARMTLGPKHPWALGRSFPEVFSEVWSDVRARAESVLRTGRATWDESLLLFLQRRGFAEETYHTFSYSPIPDDDARIGGMLCVVTEDTERIIGERRLRMLRELGTHTTAEGRSAVEACRAAARTLTEDSLDLPFALIYLLDDDAAVARLCGVCGLPDGSRAAPHSIPLDQDGEPQAGWPFRRVLGAGRAEVVTGLEARFGPLRCGPWPEPIHQAIVIPMAKPGQFRPAGFVVAGVSPRLIFNDDYQGFLDLVASHIATAVANCRVHEEERKRVGALAELDRAKTAFLSNVSHELRNPISLIIDPIESLLDPTRSTLPPPVRDQLEIVHRNSLLLLKLVNTMLDFSRLETGGEGPQHGSEFIDRPPAPDKSANISR